MRGKLMVKAMSRQECNRNLVMLENVNRCRRIAPRSERVDGCNWYVAFEFLKTSSADNGNTYRIWVLSVAGSHKNK
jgi:hypothetical protein